MPPLELYCPHEQTHSPILSNFSCGGLFLEPTVPETFIRLISSRIPPSTASCSVSSTYTSQKPVVCKGFRRNSGTVGGWFLSASLRGGKFVAEVKLDEVQNGDESSEKVDSCGDTVFEEGKSKKIRVRGGNAMNTTKHLWAGAIAAMVSRYITFVFNLMICL